jgi:[ribosomal protein S18]-alanine N-acetyltransferase
MPLRMTAEHPPLTFHIRPLEEKDLETAHAIDRLSFPIPWPASSLRYELFSNPASICLAAKEAGEDELIGFIVVWLIMDEAHIATIAVHPDFRRQGVGRALLVEGLRQSIRRGASSASLEVRAGNLAALALYRELGMDVVGKRSGYYKDNGEDALLMSVYDLDEAALERLDGGTGDERSQR